MGPPGTQSAAEAGAARRLPLAGGASVRCRRFPGRSGRSARLDAPVALRQHRIGDMEPAVVVGDAEEGAALGLESRQDLLVGTVPAPCSTSFPASSAIPADANAPAATTNLSISIPPPTPSSRPRSIR